MSSPADHEMLSALTGQFKRNLEAFRQYLPDVAEAYAQYTPARQFSFIRSAASGVPNILFHDTNEYLYPDDPLSFCRAQVSERITSQPFALSYYSRQFNWSSSIHVRYLNEAVAVTDTYARTPVTPDKTGALAHCVMVGCGLGYQLELLYGQVEVANLVLIEPDSDVFYASMHAFDWASLLSFIFSNHLGLNLLVGTKPQDLYRIMHDYYCRHGRFLAAQRWVYVHYQSPAIRQILTALNLDYTAHFDSMGFFDDVLMGLSHGLTSALAGRNFLLKKRMLPESVTAAPAFIVGNGPSLDHDLPYIRAHQHEAFIFACGTAIDTLYHAGVNADFYCATERLPQVARSVTLTIKDQTYLDRVILLATDVIHPNLFSVFRKHALFAKPDEAFFWLFRLILEPQGSLMRPIDIINPLVANMGTAAAVNLGFTKLYFFGIDNGSRTPDRLHAQGSTLFGGNYSDKQSDYQIGERTAANFGGECLTNSLFNTCRRHIEQLLAAHPEVLAVNCSDGAAIAGAEPVHSEDLQADFIDPAVKQSFLDGFVSTMTFRPTCTREEILRLLNFEAFDQLTDSLTAVFAHRAENRCDFVRQMQKCSEMNAALETARPTFFLSKLLSGSLQSLFMCITTALFHSDDEQECLKDANRITDLLLYLLEDAKKLYRHAPDYVTQEHLKFLSGKVGGDYPDSPAPEVADYDYDYQIVDRKP